MDLKLAALDSLPVVDYGLVKYLRRCWRRVSQPEMRNCVLGLKFLGFAADVAHVYPYV